MSFSVAIHFSVFLDIYKSGYYAISSDISGNVNRRVTFLAPLTKIYMLREAKRIAKEVGADFREK
jgi:hypothetical protein